MTLKELRLRVAVSVVISFLLLITVIGIIYLTWQRREQIFDPQPSYAELTLEEDETATLNRFIELGNRLQTEVRSLEVELVEYRSALQNDGVRVYQHKLTTGSKELDQFSYVAEGLSQEQEFLNTVQAYQDRVRALRANSILLARSQLPNSELTPQERSEVIQKLEESVTQFEEIHSQFMQSVLSLASNYTQGDIAQDILTDSNMVFATLLTQESFLNAILQADKPNALDLRELSSLLEQSRTQIDALEQNPAFLTMENAEDFSILGRQAKEQYDLLRVELLNVQTEMNTLLTSLQNNNVNREQFYRLGDRILSAYNDAVNAYNSYRVTVEQLQARQLELEQFIF